MVGPKKQDFWPKINILKGNHCIVRIRNTGSTSLSKIGHDFRKQSGSKIEVRKKMLDPHENQSQIM